MQPSHTPPEGANSPTASRPVHFTDPDDVRTWLTAARTVADDLIALAHEATRPFRQRLLSRPEMRRRADAASVELTRLLDAAAAGLPKGGAP